MAFDPLNPEGCLSEEQLRALDKLSQSIVLIREAEQELKGAIRLEEGHIRKNGLLEVLQKVEGVKRYSEKMYHKLRP